MAINHSLLRELFIAACDLPAPEQTAFLDEHCAEDESLREELARLLDNDHATDGVLKDADLTKGLQLDVDTLLEEQHPEKIGRYRVKRVLGQGGMGIVYLAKQENPKRDVAVKVIRPGIMSRELLKRFEFEAEVLGRLQHPGIAKIHEADIFDDGSERRPFFVMDYVNGSPLNEFARDDEFNLVDRLKLFVQICKAVHHAHQRGVIHRDLKPGNILVTEDGRPQILDFGIARATETDRQRTKLQTHAGQMIGTLPYMSPEQAMGQSSDVDTRSDVYSLGVIVFEMLTGKLPYDLRNQTIVNSVRTISEQEPTPLSKFNRDCRGDLNTVVLKALEKDPGRRYQSAAAFADDVERYLNSEPVVARRATALYQFTKFSSRNKSLVAVLMVSVLLLITGAIAATVGMLNAQYKTKQVVAINEFMSDILVSPDPGLGNANVKMIDVLLEAAANAPVRFRDYPETEADVSHMLGKALCRLTREGEAIPLLRRAYEIRKTELGETDSLTRRAGISLVFAMMNYDSSNAIQLAKNLLAQIPPNEVHGPHDLEIRRLLATLHRRHGKCDLAEQSLREVLSIAEHAPEPDKELILQTKVSLGLVLDLKFQLATYDNSEQDLNEAIVLLREAIDGFKTILDPDDSETIRATLNLVDVLRRAGEFEEAERHCFYVIDMAPERFGPDHEYCSRPRKDLVFMRFAQSRFEEAADYSKQVVEMTRRRSGSVDVKVLVQMLNAVPVLEAAGQFAVGEEYTRELLAYKGSLHRNSARKNQLYLARFLSGQGKKAEAEKLFQEVLDSGVLETNAFIDCIYCMFMREHKLAGGNVDEADELLNEAFQRRQLLGETSNLSIARFDIEFDKLKLSLARD